jgi:hypothetical protein
MFNKTAFIKTTLLYGFMAGLATIIYFLALYVADVVPLAGKKAPSIVFTLILMILAVRHYRKQKVDEILHFWEGMIVANAMLLLGACVSALFLWVFLSYIEPSVLTQYVVESIKTFELPNVKNQFIQEMGQASYNYVLDGFRHLSSRDIAIDEIVGLQGKLPLGFLVSVLVSLYFRRQYVREA